MKKTLLKRLLCLSVTAAVAVSLGSVSLADETEEDGVSSVEVEEADDLDVGEGEEFTEAEDTAEEDAIDIDAPDDELIFEEVTDLDVFEEIESIEAEDVSAGGDIPSNGWYEFQTGYYRYYIDGIMASNTLMTIKGKTYHFDENGVMSVGLRSVYDQDIGNYRYCLFGLNGAMLTGWQEYNGYKYYFDPDDDGFAATDKWIKDSNGNYFYAASSGQMYKNGLYKINGKYYGFDNNGVMLKNSFYTNDDYSLMYSGDFDLYYLGSDGAAVRGWKKIDGKYYYFDKNSDNMPYAYRMTVATIGGEDYFFDCDGAMGTGWIKTPSGEWIYADDSGALVKGAFRKIDNKWYYFDDTYCMVTGWYFINGTSYYFTKSGVMKTGWAKIDDIWYYFETSGKLAEGLKTLNGKTYYFDDGEMVTGIRKIGSDWYCFGDDGVMKKDCLFEVGFEDTNPYIYVFGPPSDSRYFMYLGSDGKAFSGWKKIDGNWYYFSPDEYNFDFPASVTGSYKIDGIYYYFDSNGILMKSKWVDLSAINSLVPKGLWIYITDSGAMAIGWKKIDGKYYYFDPDEPFMMTGLFSDSTGKYFYCNKNGVMQTGWINVNGDYLYANSKGELQTGWQTIGGKKYYFDPTNYTMVTGYRWIGYKYYYFDNNGVCKNYDNPYITLYVN